jgi:hypothetical protein
VKPAMTGSFSPPSPLNFCSNDTVTLNFTSSNATAYQWYFGTSAISGATASTLNLSQAGNYYVVFGDAHCTRVSDTVQAISHAAPVSVITAYTPTTFCSGDSVYLFALTGIGQNYQWKRNNIVIAGATNSFYMAMVSGDYTVLTSNSTCSTLSAPITVTVNPLHPLNLGNDTILCSDASITLNAGAGANNYLWTTGATGATIIVDSSGIGIGSILISVTATLNGCDNIDDILITFVDCSSIEEIQKQNFTIYPNPVEDILEITSHNIKDKNIIVSIYSLDGKLLINSNLTINNGEKLTLDMSSYPAGTYLIKIVGEQTSINQLIVKSKY